VNKTTFFCLFEQNPGKSGKDFILKKNFFSEISEKSNVNEIGGQKWYLTGQNSAGMFFEPFKSTM
jgi:hypothetical protein